MQHQDRIIVGTSSIDTTWISFHTAIIFGITFLHSSDSCQLGCKPVYINDFIHNLRHDTLLTAIQVAGLQTDWWLYFLTQCISPSRLGQISIMSRAANDSSVFTITEKAPTWAFSWLKAPTSASTLKTLLRHYDKRALTPGIVRGSLNRIVARNFLAWFRTY